MSKRKYDKPIAGHEYDGIQELNNPLPKWWLATFYGTIVFSFFYFGYFQLGRAPSQDERLAAAMAHIEGRQEEAAETTAHEAAEPVDVEALEHDPAVLAVGKAQFATKCLPCHGAAGEGIIGPNLTDNYWIHSKGDLQGILDSFRIGFPEKGMPPWGELIPPEEHVPLAIYVMSLQGTAPPNPKEPQGEPVE
jgi:cytochrome c oxidase cbb3-type subunit 3